jgi:hypothetical protein
MMFRNPPSQPDRCRNMAVRIRQLRRHVGRLRAEAIEAG